MRILTDIPDEDIERLDALAVREKRSRAAAIRDAVKSYLAQHSGSNDWISQGAGLWQARADIGDAVDYQRGLREDRTPIKDT
jgi:predicted transcriptional regulator